jgi:hypothetical protein
VQLTAVPDPGYAFLNWAGDCMSTSTVCDVTADAERFVLPVFAPLQSFEVRVKGPGVVEIDGGDCIRGCAHEVPQGTTVELVARPDRKATFVHWSGRCKGERRRCVVPVKERNAVTARFAKR